MAHSDPFCIVCIVGWAEVTNEPCRILLMRTSPEPRNEESWESLHKWRDARRTHTYVSHTVICMYCTNYISKFGMRDERLVASTSPNHFATIVARAGLFADSWPIAFVCWFAVTIPCTRSMYCARRAVAASTLSAI